MAAASILAKHAKRTGWDQRTMFYLLCEYIDRQMSDEALEDFVAQRADEECAESTVTTDDD